MSPGLTAELIDAARSSKLPLLPGVMTPSDVIAARAAGFFALKLFPAQQAGGIDMLKALRGPFPDVTFCPTGGVTAASAPGYLALPNVGCVGGSWLTPPAAVKAGAWGKITALALDAVRAISREVEDAIVGVGTISRPEHFQQAIDAGASLV